MTHKLLGNELVDLLIDFLNRNAGVVSVAVGLVIILILISCKQGDT